MSSRVMTPSGPEPSTSARSTPRSFANLRTGGFASGRPSRTGRAGPAGPGPPTQGEPAPAVFRNLPAGRFPRGGPSPRGPGGPGGGGGGPCAAAPPTPRALRPTGTAGPVADQDVATATVVDLVDRG